MKVTRDNVALMGKIKAAAGNRVFNASWDATYDEFVNSAYKGIDACGEKDLDRLNAAIAELGALNKKWHSQFR